MVLSDPDLRAHHEQIDKEVKKAYSVAEKARAKGFDPEDYVDVPIAADLAEKAARLITTSSFPELEGSGVVERIRELEKEYGKNDERVGFVIGKEIAQNKFFKFESLERAVEGGVRIGLSYMTIGTVTAPLEGISSVKIKKNDDGSEYLAIYYSGPIRSAGGTGQAMSVMLADYIRIAIGLDMYKPTKEELERYATEVEDYFSRVTKKQYTPSPEETKMIAQNVPVEITGTPTEKIEVSNYKDLPRVETNVVRGGMCLIYLDGLPLKAPKLKKKIIKYGKDFGLEHWGWLEEYLNLQTKIHAVGGKASEEKYTPNTSFMDDIVGGRPIIGGPGSFGGLRLRYGRSRASGDATTSLHPATFEITNRFISVATQLRLEYPGKATSPTVCDSIHPPIVRLKNGDVILVENRKQANEIRSEIEKILFLGDILVPFGEFVKNGKKLVPSPYVDEWWSLELEEAIKKNSSTIYLQYSQNWRLIPPLEEAFKISEELGVPLHPQYLYLWDRVGWSQICEIKSKIDEFGKEIPYETHIKDCLERLWALHKVRDGKILLDDNFYRVVKRILSKVSSKDETKNPLKKLSELNGFEINDKAPMFFGGRMGRPEKARIRTLKGKPQLLFPCGTIEGGRLRNLSETYKKRVLTEYFPLFKCDSCSRTLPFKYCPFCEQKTQSILKCIKCGKNVESDTHCGAHTVHSSSVSINVKELMDVALSRTKLTLPELLKSPRKVMGKDYMVEPLEKGLLRHKYGLYVNKDGTIRYDASNVALTHFKPREIGTPIERLRELGYEMDVLGKPLENKDQILVLKPQDVVVSDNELDSCAQVLFNVSRFTDDLLEQLYGLSRFYNLESKDDLVGQLIIGLAPHTSAGTIGRIIGCSPFKCTMAHPFWHGSKRRDCDGDEDSVMLLMDALLNFSRDFLPQHTGGRTMDAPLILSSLLNPDEVDDEAWSPETVSKYDLAFYNATWEYKYPWEVRVETFADLIGEDRSIKSSYTHETSDMNDGPVETFYVTIKDMADKVRHQLELARKIKAVDENFVAELVINRHFLGDLKGNLSRFGRQTFRCAKCQAKYRRIPLGGGCTCGSKLTFTVHEGSIRKYLEPSEQIVENFEISDYTAQQIKLLRYRLFEMFGKEEKQFSLGSFVKA